MISLRPLLPLLVQVVIGSTIFNAGVANAQRADELQLRIGVGTFLSHDRGWNYGEPIEFLVAVTRATGSVDLEAGASFSKSFAHFSSPAVYPPPPSEYRDGFRVRLGVRAPAATQLAISGLLGTELVVNQTDSETLATTVGGVIGAALNFGPARRAALDLRYVRFAKKLGSSRGILPLTLSWRL